jgi:serine/threonine protein kinase, bacterial
MKKQFAFVITLLVSLFFFQPEKWTVSTVCGANDTGHQIDGDKEKACFSDKLAHSTIDAAGNLYVIDMDALRKVSPDGSVTSLLGSLISDVEGNRVALPTLNNINGVCLGKDRMIYLSAGNAIAQFDPATRTITPLAGHNESGNNDGHLLEARFENPRGLCMDKAGNMYVADANNRRIRKIAAGTGMVTTLAGNERDGNYKPGTGKGANFFPFRSIAIDSKGNIYVPQNGSVGNCVAKVSPAGVVTTLAGDVEFRGAANDGAGKAAHFNLINCIAVDAQDNVIVGEQYRIRKITPAGVVTTIAGINEPQWKDGAGAQARFGLIGGISVDAKGALYISDLYCIRKVVKQ